MFNIVLGIKKKIIVKKTWIRGQTIIIFKDVLSCININHKVDKKKGEQLN